MVLMGSYIPDLYHIGPASCGSTLNTHICGLSTENLLEPCQTLSTPRNTNKTDQNS